MEALRARHRAGLSLKQSVVILDDPPLKSSAYERCGSWRKAIRLAGLENELQRERKAVVRKDAVYPSAAAVIAELTARHRARKSSSQGKVSKEDHSLKNAAYRYLGSWPAAIEAAGLVEVSKAQRKKSYLGRGTYSTRSSVIATLKRRASEAKTLILTRIMTEDPRLRSGALLRFGTWLAAIRAAGLMGRYETENPHHESRYPGKAEVIRTLLRRARKHGISVAELSLHDIEREDPPLKGAIYRLFGSWVKARHRALEAGAQLER